jgi:predicted Zn-dependent peptidase
LTGAGNSQNNYVISESDIGGVITDNKHDNYIKISPFLHLVISPADRQKINMEVLFNTGGSLFESPEDRGRMHLLEHCICSRTKDMDFWQLKDFAFRNNIVFNAYTTPISMAVNASGHSSDFEAILKILLEMAFSPTFEESILEREKDIVLREINERRGDPNYQLYFEVMEQIFTKDSLENHQVLGMSEIVAETTLKDMKRLYGEMLGRSMAVIELSGGGFDKKSCLENLYNFFKEVD